MRYIIDSYAWLEYFMGSEAGRKVKEIIDSQEQVALVSEIIRRATAGATEPAR